MINLGRAALDQVLQSVGERPLQPVDGAQSLEEGFSRSNLVKELVPSVHENAK